MPNLTNTARLGDIFVHGWHGRMPGLQKLVDDYSRIGAFGSGSQIVGTRARKASIKCWMGTASQAEAKTAADTLEAMQGTVVQVVDDFGRTFPRVRFQEVSLTMCAGFGPTLPSGTQMLYRIDIDLTLEVLP